MIVSVVLVAAEIVTCVWLSGGVAVPIQFAPMFQLPEVPPTQFAVFVKARSFSNEYYEKYNVR
jgi:hypothetical protein